MSASPYDYSIQFIITGIGQAQPPVGPVVCDAQILSVEIIQPESAPGASDAIIKIHATSSYGPISYSLNAGANYQVSDTFTGLTGGLYTAYIIDDNDCTASLQFAVPVLSALLVDGPDVQVSIGNFSRWNAAFNPVVFKYQRKDFQVVSVINQSGINKTRVQVNANLTGVAVGDLVYINAAPYNQVATVLTVVNSNTIVLDIPFTANAASGFVNINRLRKNYRVDTVIKYFDKITDTFQEATSRNTPNRTGLVTADISTFLQSILRTTDESDYTQLNFRDDNLSASYTIKYAEVWDGKTAEYVEIEDPYYVTFAARQLGDLYGGNMGEFVPFANETNPDKLAKFVTDFKEPVYTQGYPFDLSFIYSENILGLPIQINIDLLDINRNVIGDGSDAFLLNEDQSFLLNEDASKLIIYKGGGLYGLPEKLGLNRLLIASNYADDVYYLRIRLFYMLNGQPKYITQTQIVKINKDCDDHTVYMRWIGKTGSWNYYAFGYNQIVDLDVQNAQIIKQFVTDWQNQLGIEKVLGKSAGKKITVTAEDMPVDEIEGLEAIKYSPEVQMLVSRNPIKWQTVVLNTATFAEYETRYDAAQFKLTFNLPSINVQNQ